MSEKSSSSFPLSRDCVQAEEEEEEEWEVRGGEWQRPQQGYFYETHNKDMEMKHLYAT